MRDPLEIVVLNERDPEHPRAGGAEIHVERLFARLAARGHAVRWWSTGFLGGLRFSGFTCSGSGGRGFGRSLALGLFLLAAGGGFLGFALGTLGRTLLLLDLGLGGHGLARVDVLDVFRDEDRQEAEHRLFEAQSALDVRNDGAVVQELEGVVVTLVELADLVGELALAVILTHEPRGAAGLEDPVELRQDGLAAFVRDLGLDDERRFVFPQNFPPGRPPSSHASRKSQPGHPCFPRTARAERGRSAAGFRGSKEMTEVMG